MDPVVRKFNCFVRFLFLVFLSSTVLMSCSCSSGSDEPPPSAKPATQSINGGGVKGPLANAIVTVYTLDYTQPDFKGSVVASGTTDSTAAITGLALPLPLTPPYLFEFTSDALTVDLTTGVAPVITSLRTIAIDTAMLSSLIYATPLTTMATDLAILNADKASPYSGNNDGTTTEAEILAALTIARQQVLSTLGFGMGADVDIFRSSPIINSSTNDAASQTAVAAYRTAIEATTAVLFNMANSATQTTDAMLAEVVRDLADGEIDGIVNGSPSTIIGSTELAFLTDSNPAALIIPNSTRTADEVEDILNDERNQTGNTGIDTSGMGTVTPIPALPQSDIDSDTVPDVVDNCVNVANPDQADINGNSIGDACETPVSVPDVVGSSEGAARTTLQNAGMQVTVYRVNDNAPVDEVISQNPVAGTDVLSGTTITLTVSDGPVMVAMPDVVGMNLMLAQNTLQGLGFTNISVGRVNDLTPIDEVIGQGPAANTQMAINATINLTVSNGVAVVDVVGMTEADATNALQATGLTVNAIRVSDIAPIGRVISQSPADGNNLNPGATVTITVSDGITVPDLVGATIAAATSQLQALGLNVSENRANDAAPVDEVIAQNVSPGTHVSGGSIIVLTVSDGPGGSGSANLGGVWMIDAVVANDSPVGCKGGTGATGGTVVTVTQSGNQLTMRSYEGEMLTGTINTAGVFSATGTTNRMIADLNQPTSDSAFVTWSQSLNINGTLISANTFTGSITTTTSEDGNVTCTSSQNLSGSFVYRHNGSENYSGVYAFEYANEELNSDGSSDFEREGFPFEIEIAGTNIEFYFPDDGVESVNDTITFSNVSYEPTTGYFTIDIDETERWENGIPDGTIDASEKRHYEMTGIFMRNPAVTNGGDGAPLVVWASRGYTHFYGGDVNDSIPPFASQNEREFAYGKRLVTQAMTRTFLVEKDDQSEETQIMVGIQNPPLRRVDPNGALYIEVLNQSGSVLCAAPYISDGVADGRYFEHLRLGLPPAPLDPDIDSLAFRNGSYSTVNCNTSVSGVDQISNNETLTVRVLDTGPNGVKDTTGMMILNDDVLMYSATYQAEVVAPVDRFSDTVSVFDISVNGSTASTTLGGDTVPLFGYFDGGEQLNISWPAVPGADSYQLRLQESEGGVDDIVKWRFTTTATNITIPAEVLDDDIKALRVIATKTSASNNAQAMSYSRRLEVQSGIRGLFNIELGSALPLTHQTFQLYIEAGFFGSVCVPSSNLWPVSCSFASVNFFSDTVTLNMVDLDGTYTGMQNGSFTLDLHFSDAGLAEVTSFNNIPGVPMITGSGTTAAKAANPEFYLRTERMSHNGTQRTRINITNSFPLLFDRAVLSREDGGAFGGGVITSVVLWDESGGLPYMDVATEFVTVPTDDGDPQRTKLMASFHSNNLGFGNIVLASSIYKLELFTTSGAEPAVLRYNYTAPGAADYIAPDDTGITLDGTDCSVSICNDPALPITVTNSPDLSWAVDPAVPAGSFWRVVFRRTDTTGNAASERVGQVRTPFMADGNYGLSIASGTATWTNPGSLILPPGEYEVQIHVYDSDSGLNSTVLGTSSGPSGIGNDLTYISVP